MHTPGLVMWCIQGWIPVSSALSEPLKMLSFRLMDRFVNQ